MNFLPGCGLQGDGANLLVGPTLDETGDLTECPGSTTARLGGVSNDDDFTNTGVRGMEDRDDIDFAASSRSASKYSRSHVDQTASR